MKYLNKSFDVFVTSPFGKSCDTCNKKGCNKCTNGYTKYHNINDKSWVGKLLNKIRGNPQ